MSRKVSEIKDDFDRESEVIKAAVNGGELDTFSYDIPSVTSHEETVTAYFGSVEEKQTVTKYDFNGGVYNTERLALDARNALIDYYVALVDIKIGLCNSYKSRLSALNADCTDSAANLSADLTELGNAEKDYNSQISQVCDQITNYNDAVNSIASAFNCSPSGLITETNDGFSYISGLNSSEISSAKGKISDYLDQVNDMITQISEMISSIDEKATKLEEMKGRLQRLKK